MQVCLLNRLRNKNRLILLISNKFSSPNSTSPIAEEYLRKVLRKTEKEKYDEWFDLNTAQETTTEVIQNSIINPEKNTIIVSHPVKYVGDAKEGLLDTPYGNLLIPKFYLEKLNNKVSTVYHLENDTKANFIRKVYKEDRNALLLFGPRTHYHNIRNLLESFSRKIAEFYFSPKQLSKNLEITRKTPEEAAKIYHSTVRKTLEMRSFLNRVCVVLNRDFTLRNEFSPDLQLALPRYLKEFGMFDEADFDKDSFYRHDFLVPLSVLLKVHSLKNLEENGVAIDFLFDIFDSDVKSHKKELFNPKIFRNEFHLNPEQVFKDDFMENSEVKKIEHQNLVSKNRLFPAIGTFPPTNRVLLKFLFNKMKDKANFLKFKKNVLDIGVGTGILPIIFRLAVQSTKQTFYAIDKNLSAVECAKRNCLLHNIFLNAQVVDIVEVASLGNSGNKKEKSVGEENGLEIGATLANEFPEKFDFIICNPPWITAKPIDDYDTGNYDQQERMLKAVFGLLPRILDRSAGVFWLVYSDLSELLGLQEKNRVEELCLQFGLIVKTKSVCSADLIEKKVRTDVDLVKQKSKYFVYEITF